MTGINSVTVQPVSSKVSRRATSSGPSPSSMTPATISISQGENPAA